MTTLEPIVSEISNALLNNEFELAYQPQLSCANGALIGFEALIRWHSPHRGLISPAVFIPIAEQSGQILAIGEWVLRRACSDLCGFIRAGMSRDLHVAVNVSALQLAHQDLPSLCFAATSEVGLQPANLHLELTETALIEKPAKARRQVHSLHSAGYEVWIDDFGTGYASLRMLRDFDISGLKIDRSFISRVTEDEDDFCIVSAMLAMAQRLRLRTVAEGIETEEQLQIISQLGCTTGQGYLLGRPMSTDKVLASW